MSNQLDQLSVNTIRMLSVEAITKANSGHPGLPLGAAPMVYELYAHHLKYNPGNAKWVNRDRFVLSAGHGSALLYAVLHVFGYPVSIEDIQNFRQIGSITPGHPEYGVTEGVEISTGPLGQGIANAVGMALAEKMLAARFNKEGISLIDHYTYVLVGDGCLMEGISYEAMSLAGNLKLGKLIVLYDSNNITIEGSTDLTFTEDSKKRFEGAGFQVLFIEDGNDIDAIGKAIEEAKNEKEKPSIIVVKTKIGYGSPKENTAGVHGSPLSKEEVLKTKENLGITWEEEFFVPEEVKEERKAYVQKGKEQEEEWNQLLMYYQLKYPEEYWKFIQYVHGMYEEGQVLDDGFIENLKAAATRSASSDALQNIAKNVPNLIGGSADLGPSNKTVIKDGGSVSGDDATGRNIHFGIREHAMGAIANGITAHGGFRTYVSTFLSFSDYLKPAVRMAALMKLPIIYIFTHDSLFVGEDGPTHQPIEQVFALRSIPNVTVFRPADPKETVYAWDYAIHHKEEPVAFILTRQDVPLLKETNENTKKGAYVLKDFGQGDIDVLLMATGSEVELILKAGEVLEQEGIHARVISMPSLEVFKKQAKEYQEEIIPSGVKARVCVEAGITAPWYQYAGEKGKIIGIDRFGISGPGEQVMKQYGFTVENIVNQAKESLK